jgi:hypothetical protein
MAGGCYAVRSLDSDRYLAHTSEGLAATGDNAAEAEPFHFQATDLGRYLLYGSSEDFLAVSDGLLGEVVDGFTESSAGALFDGLTRDESIALRNAIAESDAGTATGRGSAVGIGEKPSELADWDITTAGDGYQISLPALDSDLTVTDGGELTLVEAGASTGFAFELTEGCAAWPEVEVNVDGPVATGRSPFGETRGYLDGHLHGMAFEFLGGRVRCGRPWHPYGVEYALRGCKEHEESGGRTHVVENVLSGRDPVQGHDTTGWPTFQDWPAHSSLTYEQTYYKWLERAWRGGLRMYTNLLVDNHVLCELYPFKRNSCNEMDGVLLQAQRLREFERYIDAQNGGPGRGWLRIVTDPFQARQVINQGKLAVVMGVEVSVPFDCGLRFSQPQCDTAQIDNWIDELHQLGIRQMEIVNKFDNALTGVKGDAGTTGVITNSGNFYSTGQFWQLRTCEEDEPHDHQQHNVHDDAGTPDELTGRDALVGLLLRETGQTGAAPLYGQAPHCNTRGLSDLGEHVIKRMAELGMIFDPDHMSAKARHEAMDLIERESYSGVISSHSWADDEIYRRVLAAGGVVTPMAGDSQSFVDTWRKHKRWADDRYMFGFGYGSDINGFAAQGGPREGGDLRYPFTGFGGVTVHQQRSGERTYDINTDGVAHYGLYPDWVEDLRLQAGDDIIADLERGPEAYLQMWERAVGIPGDSCRPDVRTLSDSDIERLGQGMTPERVLATLGQPHSRTGHSFRYCMTGGRTASVTFNDNGRLDKVSHP